MRVLLVDDDPLAQGLAEELLVRRGHEVVACADAESGWQAHQTEPFPLMVLDWMLPGGMDGLELCRRLRASPDGDRPVVLVMTARDQPADLAAVLDAGADDYVAKPFNLDILDIRLAVAERHVEMVAARVRAQAALRDQARLQGALAAATTVEHYLGNQLARTLGFAALLVEDPRLPDDLRGFAEDAVRGARDADETLRKLLRITRLEEVDDFPGRTVIDLDRSADAPS
jgi:two-component system phosphate regulon response regulator PhoB